MNDKETSKQKIYDSLFFMKQKREKEISVLNDTVSLSAYRSLARKTEEGFVWTQALQTALQEHERIIIEPSEDIYFLDNTVCIPSNRHIEAIGATVRLCKDCNVLMLRNEHTRDGTHFPIQGCEKDCNISIHGGRWEESNSKRLGYGASGRYAPVSDDDENREFYGVSTCMLFNNIEGLSLSDMTFAHTAGFAVQVGDIKNAVFENISFVSCYADGLHVNGGSQNLYLSHIKGEVGDDLVALNAYDWQNSSVNFGEIRNVVCEHLQLSASSRYKAIRIEPGVYRYDDGTTVDCGIFDTVIKDVRGIRTFKLYLQTPPYILGESPEFGKVGSVDNLFFEDIEIDLTAPIDNFGPYKAQDPLLGNFAAFELGANIGNISFENIRLTLHEDEWKYSYLVCIGPKSSCINGKEFFDPYLSCHAQNLIFKNILINGEPVKDILSLIREIEFHDVNKDGFSTGKGTVGSITFNGISVK
ncbi:MAG: hypothetical protein E7603_09440 [Ruminococcaceae bacterium]|nr:hypothetical protein [Oscillospiraceae bacterium]